MRSEGLILKFVLVIIGLLIFGYLANRQQTKEEQELRDWCKQEGYELVEIESKSFDYGPFWTKDDHQNIYRTIIRDRAEHPKIIWHRSGVFGWDHEEYKR